MKRATRIRCNQCEALMINGVFCHEIGCPNTSARYEDGEWVKYFDCFYCGYQFREGEPCECTSEEVEKRGQSN